MIQILFAVFMIASAWTAMRRHPAYHSSRSTLRSVAVILLAIAAVIAVIIAAVNFSTGRSPAVTIATIVVVILFGCFFLVYVIYTVSTPKAAKLTTALPPGVELVHFNRRKVYVWGKAAGIVLLVCAVAALLLPGESKYVAYSLGAFTLFIAAILLPILYWSMRMLDVSLTALEANPWVHWTYTPEQWQQWTQVQVERAKAAPPGVDLKKVLPRLAFAFVFIAAGVYLFVPGAFVWKTAYLVFIFAVLLAVPLLSARSGRSAPERLRAKLLRASPEVYFGQDGVFCNGAFTTWLTGDVFLRAASIDEREPRSLLFRFEKDVPNPYGPLQVIPIEQAVLIPAGVPGGEQEQQRDLATLQARLTERCPTAKVTLA